LFVCKYFSIIKKKGFKDTVLYKNIMISDENAMKIREKYENDFFDNMVSSHISEQQPSEKRKELLLLLTKLDQMFVTKNWKIDDLWLNWTTIEVGGIGMYYIMTTKENASWDVAEFNEMVVNIKKRICMKDVIMIQG
jgi:hypothetical protein